MNELAPRALQGANANWSTGPNYSVYTFFQITDAYNYFPIPDSEMSVNKAITQNNPVGNQVSETRIIIPNK